MSPCQHMAFGRHTQHCDANTSVPSRHLGTATPGWPRVPRVQRNLCFLQLKLAEEEAQPGWLLWVLSCQGRSVVQGTQPHVPQLLQEPLFGVAPEESPDSGCHCQPLPRGADGGPAARGITGAAVLPDGSTQEQSWLCSSWCTLQPTSKPQGSVRPHLLPGLSTGYLGSGLCSHPYVYVWELSCLDAFPPCPVLLCSPLPLLLTWLQAERQA